MELNSFKDNKYINFGIVYVLIFYETKYSDNLKISKNFILAPLINDIYNFCIVKDIKINKKNGKIKDEFVDILSSCLRFSTGPYFYEKPTHIYLNTLEYFNNNMNLIKKKIKI